MDVLRMMRDEIANLGYASPAIITDYVFSDVFAAQTRDRAISLAAFTRTPASYRNAALGVLSARGAEAETLVSEYRALGAPLLFVICEDDISVWKVVTDTKPRLITRVAPDKMPALFRDNAGIWNPDSIHRAKSIGQVERHYQLDFIDLGLLPAIEGQIHAKLGHLLAEILAAIQREGKKDSRPIDDRSIFRVVFRLLAAKILQDRGHPLAALWDPRDLKTVLNTIRNHYSLPTFANDHGRDRIFELGWERLRHGISFRNISADDLAFVYENTLVTADTRKRFGTHSTPRQVAEFVVNRLSFSLGQDGADLRIYEPFAGAGVFLVAAMRSLKDVLPTSWSDENRHEFLVSRIYGDESDAFACEVARLSMILADYPHANGWHVGQMDLFADNKLTERATGADVVLCNPPFEDFTEEDRLKYSEAAARSHSKPIAALNAILDARPANLGFVLPPIFIDGRKYAEIRCRIEATYQDIEIVELPEHTFKKSQMRSALLIARDVRHQTDVSRTTLRSSTVSSNERDRFFETGQVSFSRQRVRSKPTSGRLWIRELDELWEYLSTYPKLSMIAAPHRGVEWTGPQSQAVSQTAKPGFVGGLASASDVSQYAHTKPSFLDVRPGVFRSRANAIALPWREPKLLANASRRSRDAWCLAAAIDQSGLVASQQLYGVWPTGPDVPLEILCAILNGPLANAYARDHSSDARLLVSALEDIPIPNQFPNDIVALVRAYVAIIGDRSVLIGPSDAQKGDLLNRIDAAILKAYDLPPRLEKIVLEQFRGARRPTLHEWKYWFPENFEPSLPLYRYLSDEYKLATSGWVANVFKPLPADEAEAIGEYLD